MLLWQYALCLAIFPTFRQLFPVNRFLRELGNRLWQNGSGRCCVLSVTYQKSLFGIQGHKAWFNCNIVAAVRIPPDPLWCRQYLETLPMDESAPFRLLLRGSVSNIPAVLSLLGWLLLRGTLWGCIQTKKWTKLLLWIDLEQKNTGEIPSQWTIRFVLDLSFSC